MALIDVMGNALAALTERYSEAKAEIKRLEIRDARQVKEIAHLREVRDKQLQVMLQRNADLKLQNEALQARLHPSKTAA